MYGVHGTLYKWIFVGVLMHICSLKQRDFVVIVWFSVFFFLSAAFGGSIEFSVFLYALHRIESES